ncbi:uncharacterized protein LOC127700345 isoform X2 [Mytilus californianus]|uniref:uncharacterized protein LOC127700345 isoform X2 n=1 Tax=Mytilus californianus TaxID=6549 RepID=UPI0022464C6F|nr:uncharacterized protein LOC127700345 isoform X2 [Mytilus californianus]
MKRIQSVYNMAQVTAWSVIIFIISSIIYARGQKISVFFEGRKSGNTVIFNCSIGMAPPSTTIQFLVDSVSANDIRLYDGKCYLTHTGSPCNIHQCQCSPDGKRYYWIYNEPKEKFTATCKAKFHKYCSAYANIQFTASDLTPHGHRTTTCTTSNAKHYVRGKTSTLLTCIVILITMMIG